MINTYNSDSIIVILSPDYNYMYEMISEYF